MTSTAQLIKRAQAIRDREHRVKPSLRLKNEAEMIEFIHDRGFVSVLGGNELPSIINAVLGKSWKPSAKGFKGWLDWWSLKIEGRQVRRVIGDIERRHDILATRMVKGTKTFVSDKLWPIIDPIVRLQKELLEGRKILSNLELRVLEAIDSSGSIRTDRLRKQLELEPPENNSKFHRSLINLESYALIVGAEDPKPERHLHANIWQTWDKRTGRTQARSNLSYQEALTALIGKIIDACVLAPQNRIPRLFVWTADIESAKQELLKTGEIAQVGTYLVAPRVLE